MKKELFVLMFILCTGLFLHACQTNMALKTINKIDEKKTTTSSSGYPDVEIESTTVENGTYQYSVHIPKLNADAWNMEIKRWTDQEIRRFIKDAAGKKHSNELHIDFQIYTVSENFLSVKFKKSQTLYNEKPDEETVTFNYDRKNNRFLSIIDLFQKDSGFLPFLSILSFEKLRADENISGTADREQILKGVEPAADNFRNFLIKYGKLILLFDPAQFGMDSGTEIEVALTYDELKDFLNKEYIQSFNIQEKQPEKDLEKAKKSTEQKKNSLDPDKKHVALTFDDGPHPDVTPQILDKLKEYDARATFFVLGNRVEFYPDILQRILDDGHEIGNHSWSHPQLTKLSKEEIISQLARTDEQIKKVTGENTAIMRPPYGAINDEVSAYINKPIIQWSVDTRDWKVRNADAIFSTVKSQVTDGSIILMHDIYPSTAKSLDKVLEWLDKSGYQVVTVGELLGYTTDPETIEAGKIYYSRAE